MRDIGESPLWIAYVADMIHGSGGGVVAGSQFVDLLRKRHRVTVIGVDADGPDSIALPGFVVPIRAMKAMNFKMARPIRSVLAEAIAKVDVVHLQLPFWLARVALDEAHHAGRPVVAAFHVQPENALLNVGVDARWLSTLIYRELIDHVFDRASAVVCPTRFAEHKLREHGLRAPTFVVSNGVPPDMVPMAATRAPEHEGYFLIAMVGRLAAEKRQDVLIDAVRTSRNGQRIQLVIAGAGPREKELKSLAKDLPNGAQIGFVPRDELRALLATADLFVHCSEVELEGIAVLEAMGMGLPALVADGPETAAAQLALGPEFRFPAGDVRALAERLDRFIDHPEQLALARPRCLAVAKHLSIDQSVADLESVYRHVIACEQTRACPASSWAGLRSRWFAR